MMFTQNFRAWGSIPHRGIEYLFLSERTVTFSTLFDLLVGQKHEDTLPLKGEGIVNVTTDSYFDDLIV